MNCPICNTKYDKIAATCPACDANLSGLSRVAEMPDHYFNAAVEAAAAGDWFAVIEALAVAHAFRPIDVEVLLLWGKAYIELGQLPRAANCFIKALKMDARHPDAQQYVFWLNANGCKIPLQDLMA